MIALTGSARAAPTPNRSTRTSKSGRGIVFSSRVGRWVRSELAPHRDQCQDNKSMIRMIATALLLLLVPSVLTPLAQVHTPPFLTTNSFLFCTTANSPSVIWQSMSFIMSRSGVLAPGEMTMSRMRTVLYAGIRDGLSPRSTCRTPGASSLPAGAWAMLVSGNRNVEAATPRPSIDLRSMSCIGFLPGETGSVHPNHLAILLPGDFDVNRPAPSEGRNFI